MGAVGATGVVGASGVVGATGVGGAVVGDTLGFGDGIAGALSATSEELRTSPKQLSAMSPTWLWAL